MVASGYAYKVCQHLTIASTSVAPAYLMPRLQENVMFLIWSHDISDCALTVRLPPHSIRQRDRREDGQ